MQTKGQLLENLLRIKKISQDSGIQEAAGQCAVIIEAVDKAFKEIDARYDYIDENEPENDAKYDRLRELFKALEWVGMARKWEDEGGKL